MRVELLREVPILRSELLDTLLHGYFEVAYQIQHACLGLRREIALHIFLADEFAQ